MNLFLLNNPSPQKCPSIFHKLKIVLDDTDSYGDFYLTGSQKLHLMEGVSEFLAGRASIMELEGFSLREVYDIPFTKPYGIIRETEKRGRSEAAE